MGLKCTMFGCADKPDYFWGDKAEYVLFRCERCGNETILCSKEGMVLKNDEAGRKAKDMMMSDPEFSKQCMIHSEFSRAENSTFSYSKKERLFDEIRSRYGLAPGFLQPNPVILLEKGLWKPKPLKADGESGTGRKSGSKPKAAAKRKTKGREKPARDADGESPEEIPDRVKVSIRITQSNTLDHGGDSDWVDVSGPTHRPEPSLEEQITRLERRLEKHVSREEYEKAAKIRDQIEKLKGVR